MRCVNLQGTPIDALYIRVRLFLVGLFHYEYCK